MNFVLSPILVGMPHLAYGSLSENWLFKECGHRHWLQLAHWLGEPLPDFRDRDGNRLYAAFTALRADNGGLADVREHDLIEIFSSLRRVSRTQFSSRHVVERGGRHVISVELLSAFVRRAVPGSNRTAHRHAVVERNVTGTPLEIFPQVGDLASKAREIRTGTNWRYWEFSGPERNPGRRFKFKPCPRADFNGADFLYFANFSSIVDRAEWEWRGCSSSRPVARDIFFHGNVDVGESVSVFLCAQRQRAARFEHWCEIVRDADGEKIADVFTASLESELPQRMAERGASGLRSAQRLSEHMGFD